MKENIKEKIENSSPWVKRLLAVFKYIVVIGLIAISVYYTIKETKPEALAYTLSNADYLWILLSVPVIIASHFLRAWRWKAMLRPIIKVKSVYNLFKAVMVGYAANAVTPRGGEFLRPYVYARQEQVSFTSTFATIIVERFLDLITLLSLFGLSLIIFYDQITYALKITFDMMNVNISPSSFLYFVLLFTVVLIVSFYPPIIRFFLRMIVKPFSQKLYDKISELFEKFRKGFGIIKEPRQYFRIILQSVSIWVFYGIPNYLMFYAFDFPSKYGLGADDAFLILIVVGVAVTIAPTPGALGVHHLAVRYALIVLYGISEEEAVAYAIVTHAANYILSILIGGFYYLQKRRDIPSNEEISSELDEPPAVAK